MSQPVQGRHMVSARSVRRPCSSSTLLSILPSFNSLSAVGRSTFTSPARRGCAEMGLRIGITPISASLLMPESTQSSLSQRPIMKFEETLFLPNIFTAFCRDSRTKDRDKPGQYLAKISGSMVSTLYFISVAPAS